MRVHMCIHQKRVTYLNTLSPLLFNIFPVNELHFHSIIACNTITNVYMCIIYLDALTNNAHIETSASTCTHLSGANVNIINLLPVGSHRKTDSESLCCKRTHIFTITTLSFSTFPFFLMFICLPVYIHLYAFASWHTRIHNAFIIYVIISGQIFEFPLYVSKITLISII